MTGVTLGGTTDLHKDVRNCLLRTEYNFYIQNVTIYYYIYIYIAFIKGGFPTSACLFYAGCVVCALHYMHGRDIAYRDLKPENLLIDNDGYVAHTYIYIVIYVYLYII
jgi:serine/threonine protein kinase